ncbi:3-hydroxy-9,10-secoandrosta-1,3,5(10)-triene-9,17-dione monooxygenase [Bradyrhizobium japonicum]|uniref:3-hydroxy-9,10-secoandrosta-1,3,5(10)-triene-9, 17-dione monooxygenase n=1 Tax=Bradyrhizobium japonicum TaxID=375 RepID=A0ABV2RXI0_BRAJP|nr:acyl-CoA dehydrogenase family protein [Bradyrhizobium japonicum]UQD95261.1 acyl-CoA dehydrogenase family protein [Bradyrhizobium japonicum]WLB23428.1 acyl-CoA dehydrogenase family protein [Bradyrhizobium japonicum]
MVEQHAVEFPHTQEARSFHKMNIGNLANTRCGSSAEADESVVARARNLVPELRRRSEEIHALGRIPRDLFDRLLAEGLFGLSTPQGYGGLQTSVKTKKATIAELGRGDLSVGWVAAVMNNAAWCLYALFPKHIIDRLSATHGGFRGCVTVSPVKAKVRKAPEGYVIEEGRWGFNSGVYHANWDLLAIPLVDDAGNITDHGLALVPMDAITILDDWDTMGLRGTGSSGVIVKDLFVSGELVTSTSALLSGVTQATSATAPLYRTATDPLLTISQLFPVLGAAQTAIDTFLHRLPGRMIYGLNEEKIESAVTHLQIGEITAKIDAADALVQRAAEALDRNAESMGEYMPSLDRARIRRDIGFAVRLIMEAVDTLASAYGGSAARASDPMGRIWRDLRVATLHGLLVPATSLELYGRLRCGQPQKAAML